MADESKIKLTWLPITIIQKKRKATEKPDSDSEEDVRDSVPNG